MTGETASTLLRALRNDDGGFGPRPGAPSEPEPTALATIALDDDDARAWLAARQRDDGSFGIVEGWVVDDAATGLASLAVRGVAREQALDYLEDTRALPLDGASATPHDVDVLGWPWTRSTFGWVEPTARALLALRLGRPMSASIDDAIALLRDRECVGGGWNYGNRTVLGVDLTPYAHVTAIALVAAAGLDLELQRRALDTLARLWLEERDGGLSVALSLAAFRVHGDARAAHRARGALDDLVERTDLFGDTVAIAWAAIAAGDVIEGWRSA
jgi:hypothetical protein